MLSELKEKKQGFDHFFLLSYGFLKLGELKSSYKFLQICKDLEPDNSKGFLLAAKYYLVRDEVSNSIKELKKLLALYPHNSKALKLLKQVKEKEGIEDSNVLYKNEKENKSGSLHKSIVQVRLSKDRGRVSYNLGQKPSIFKS